ncbi:formylglycine-generating enzyme family protein [candidate division KSB1 bacterium]|nr:formylglycine-generating enzyme family protein [candidate division KSB1 bacterium]
MTKILTFVFGFSFVILFVLSQCVEPNHVGRSDFRKKDDQYLPGDVLTIELAELPASAQKLEMVLIPSGEFSMGSALENRNRSDNEWPLHKVSISQPFFLARFETTQAQWQAVMGKPNHSKYKGENNPVNKVSWIECQWFMNRLNKMTGRDFRLPSEAEWEYACRAGGELCDCLNQAVLSDSCYKILQERIWWAGDNSDNKLKAVGLKQPNGWGLYDMHGNVSEWCLDRYREPSEREGVIDPVITGPKFLLLNIFVEHVFRNGSYQEPLQRCRCAFRRYEQAFDYHYTLGFRILLPAKTEK